MESQFLRTTRAADKVVILFDSNKLAPLEEVLELICFIMSRYEVSNALKRMSSQFQIEVCDNVNMTPAGGFGVCTKVVSFMWEVNLVFSKARLMQIMLPLLQMLQEEERPIMIKLQRESVYHKLRNLGLYHQYTFNTNPEFFYFGYFFTLRIKRAFFNDCLELFIDLCKMLTPNAITQTITQTITPAASLPSISDISNNDTIASIPLQNSKITKLITLTKNEVGFLLGKNGYRLDAIRKQAKCIISLLPISFKNSYLYSSRRTPQTLKIYGSKESVHNATNLININLDFFNKHGRFL